VDSLRFQALHGLIEENGLTYSLLDSLRSAGPFRFSLRETSWNQEMMRAFYALGVRLNSAGQPSEGLLCLQQAYSMAQLPQDIELAADAGYQIGNAYYLLGNYEQALAQYQQSLNTFDSLQNQERISRVVLSIGNLYFLEEKYSQALDYYQRSRQLKEETRDQDGIGTNLNNIGMVYLRLADYQQAAASFQEGIAQFAEAADSSGIANTLVSLAELLVLKQDYGEALETINQAIDIASRRNYGTVLTDALFWKSRIYQEMGEIPAAQTHAWEGLALARERGNKRLLQQHQKLLYQLHKAEGDMATALAMHEAYAALEDSLNLAGLETRLLQEELAQQSQRDRLQQEEAVAISEEKLRTGRLRLILQLVVFLIFISGSVAFGIINVRRLQLAQKQRATMAQQKSQLDDTYDQMEHKTRQISSSIEYALRIQSTILPSLQSLSDAIPDNFLLYLPKDVVAGDFYWLEHVEGKTLLAVADCTGHGVPGAIVSMVCSQALNRALREFNLTNPAEILDMTREIILARFASVRGGVPDGMDISLCCLEGNTLTFAGANHSLYLVRPEGPSSQALIEALPNAKTMTVQGNCLFEIRGDKQPIGKHPTNNAYTSHTLQLTPEDTVYMFSDGFADQLNAADGSTYKLKRLKKLLLQIAQAPMPEQRQRLQEDIADFRKDFMQVDDITILGFRWQG